MTEHLHELPAENVITVIASGASLDFILTPAGQLAVMLRYTDHLDSNYRVLLDMPQCNHLHAGLEILRGMTIEQLEAATAELRDAQEGEQ